MGKLPKAAKAKPTAAAKNKTAAKKHSAKTVKSELCKADIPQLPEGSAPNVSNSVERKMLSALAFLNSVGVETPPRDFIAALAGFTCTSSKGDVAASKGLRDRGLVEHSGGAAIRLTPTGLNAVGTAGWPPASKQEARERIKAILPQKGADIFDLLSDGRAHDRKRLAIAVGFGHTGVSR